MRFALGQYVPGDSFVHRLDPRTKMGLVAAFVGMLLAVQSWWGYGAATAMVGLGVAASRVSAARLVRGLRPLWWFVVLSVVFHAFWTEGHPLVRWGPLAVTREGLQQAAMTSLRLVLLVAGASLLTLTTSPLDLTEGLERLLTPGRRLGLPAHELAMTMTIALRFVPTLLEEADRIMKAQMARGAAFDRGGPLRRATALLPLLVPLFVSALRRADELAVAMEARCYRGGQGRTRLRQLRMGRRDAVVLVLFALAAAGVAWRW